MTWTAWGFAAAAPALAGLAVLRQLRIDSRRPDYGVTPSVHHRKENHH